MWHSFLRLCFCTSSTVPKRYYLLFLLIFLQLTIKAVLWLSILLCIWKNKMILFIFRSGLVRVWFILLDGLISALSACPSTRQNTKLEWQCVIKFKQNRLKIGLKVMVLLSFCLRTNQSGNRLVKYGPYTVCPRSLNPFYIIFTI